MNTLLIIATFVLIPKLQTTGESYCCTSCTVWNNVAPLLLILLCCHGLQKATKMLCSPNTWKQYIFKYMKQLQRRIKMLKPSKPVCWMVGSTDMVNEKLMEMWSANFVLLSWALKNFSFHHTIKKVMVNLKEACRLSKLW